MAKFCIVLYMARSNLTARAKKFFEVLYSEAYGNATEAARIAGYPHPEKASVAIKQRYPLKFREAKL